MMSKRHYIFISIIIFIFILGFSVYRYFEINERRSKELVLFDLPNNQSNNAQIQRDHLLNKKNIRSPIIQNSPDSDRGQCSKKPLFTEKIITKFAGYVLEYPCTVSSSGTIRTYFDDQNNSESIYKLYLGVVFNEDGSIWKLEHNKHESDKLAFRVNLNSNGRKIGRTTFIKQRGQMTKAHDSDINGLSLYRDFGRIVGYLNGEKDASGHPPAISCGAAAETTVEDVFSLLETSIHKLGTSCSAGWALTADIYLYMPRMTIKSKDAYHFKDIYRIINSGVRDSIISTPFLNIKISQE
ncbi:MAG: hypothetical protein L3J52_04290 [Proteobacteria bacterium]|nr:hypothetical protein [Pseudomonadota bacterium]